MQDRYDLEAELKRRGITKTEIGRRTGFTQRYVGMVMEGIRRNPVIERELARTVNIPVTTLRRIVRTNLEAAA